MGFLIRLHYYALGQMAVRLRGGRINKQIQDCIVFEESLSAVARINAVHKRVPSGRAWNGNDGVWEKRRAKKEAPVHCFHCPGSKTGMRAGKRGERERERRNTLNAYKRTWRGVQRWITGIHLAYTAPMLMWEEEYQFFFEYTYTHRSPWPLPASNNSVYGPENRIWTTLANRNDPIHSR